MPTPHGRSWPRTSAARPTASGARSRLARIAESPPRRDDTGLFAPVSVARASSAIADQIREAILTGRVPAGERLAPERELAEQFGVSRVTVRDALRSLEAMGLVEVRVGARGGAFVTTPTGSIVAQSMSDMMRMSVLSPGDVVEARLMVELGTVTLACARATDEDLAKLREACTIGAEELKAKTYTRERSWAFHSLLAAAAHNGAVEGLTQSFRSSLSMHPVRAREGAKAHVATVEEHGRIVDALEQRDGDAARRAMADHLLRGTNLAERSASLLDWWRSTPR
ncbi:MAG TPA: FadR/GntR family transcriptional regulator [Gaiellaceae bacterium]|jgi:DNA-binding FadR family transcriptional regulator